MTHTAHVMSEERANERRKKQITFLSFSETQNQLIESYCGNRTNVKQLKLFALPIQRALSHIQFIHSNLDKFEYGCIFFRFHIHF